MCSFVIRTAGIHRVVFALRSPIIGGMSRWDILQNRPSTRALKVLHGAAPEIVSGVLADEARQAWLDWGPIVARMMFMLGFFVCGEQKRLENQPYFRTGFEPTNVCGTGPVDETAS